MGKINYNLLLILTMSLILILYIVDDKNNEQTEQEKDKICYEHCISIGYNLGEHIGYSYCDCYNKTINGVSLINGAKSRW